MSRVLSRIYTTNVFFNDSKPEQLLTMRLYIDGTLLCAYKSAPIAVLGSCKKYIHTPSALCTRGTKPVYTTPTHIHAFLWISLEDSVLSYGTCEYEAQGKLTRGKSVHEYVNYAFYQLLFIAINIHVYLERKLESGIYI